MYPRVQDVRHVVDATSAHPDLDATAIHTVGAKGWANLILGRRQYVPSLNRRSPAGGCVRFHVMCQSFSVGSPNDRGTCFPT